MGVHLIGVHFISLYLMDLYFTGLHFIGSVSHSPAFYGPGLFFYHWTPPSTTNPNANSTLPPTPSEGQQLHPLSQFQSANVAEGFSSPSGPGLFFHYWTPPSTTNPNANS